MCGVKDFSLDYEAPNKEGTFTVGDTIKGTVSFTLTKETNVKYLMVTAKGNADNAPDQSKGKGTNRAHRRLFKLNEFLIAENGTLLPQGDHRFNFMFTIPKRDMPSSFKSFYGRIVYMLEAKMFRSWGLTSRFSQSGSVEKGMGLFAKGHVKLTATVDKQVCSPGDTLSVVAKTHNFSSKRLRPKVSLVQMVVYRYPFSARAQTRSLCKMVGETIAPNSMDTASCQLKIPADVTYTIQNCEIISVDYYLRVYVDISFSMDPAVLFPLFIIPASFATLQSTEAVGPYPATHEWASRNSNLPPPALPVTPFMRYRWKGKVHVIPLNI